MKIGIIGAGNIGSTLGKKWSAANHAIQFGVRDPADPKFTELRAWGAVVPLAQAAALGEILLLALPGSAVADFATQHASLLGGKTIIDATNNVRSAEMHSLTILREMAPSARLARAFSTLGWENFERPEIDGVQIDLFFCAQPAARPDIERLVAEVGLRPVYIGDIDTAPALDGMTRAWFALALGQGLGRRLAFKLMQA
jgi:hypothetical protein